MTLVTCYAAQEVDMEKINDLYFIHPHLMLNCDTAVQKVLGLSQLNNHNVWWQGVKHPHLNNGLNTATKIRLTNTSHYSQNRHFTNSDKHQNMCISPVWHYVFPDFGCALEASSFSTEAVFVKVTSDKFMFGVNTSSVIKIWRIPVPLQHPHQCFHC